MNEKKKFRLLNFFYKDFFFKTKSISLKKIELEKNFFLFLNRFVDVKKTFFLFSKYKNSQDIIYIKGENTKFIIKKEFSFKEKRYAKNFSKLLKKIPVDFKYLVKPLEYRNNYIHKYKINLFCIYPFFKGNYFDGSIKQVIIIAKAIFKTFYLFSKIKIKNNYNSFSYFKKNDKKIFNYFLKNKKKIKYSFNKEISLILKNDIKIIFQSWKYLRNLDFKKFHGIKTLCHSDIHPHNILINHNTCKILDYSRLKYMPAGYCLSYSFFKLGKQIILKNKNKIEAIKTLNILKFYYMLLFRKFKVNTIYLQELAVIEIIKRVIYALKVLKKDNKNSVKFILPTLIKNFYESKFFFKIVR